MSVSRVDDLVHEVSECIRTAGTTNARSHLDLTKCGCYADAMLPCCYHLFI